jgi:hypothetical protein
MSEQITAPWTQDQVDSINGFQQSGVMHPFTGHNDLLPMGQDDILVATVDGLQSTVKPEYHQTWVWSYMADWSWKKWRKDAWWLN